MPFRPPDRAIAPERILVGGVQSTGKTKALLDVANMAHQTDADTRFYIIDTDNGVADSLEEHPHLVERVEWAIPQGWPDIRDITADFFDRIEDGDWFAVDLLGTVWTDTVRNWWINETWGIDEEEYFTLVRKQLRKREVALDAWKQSGSDKGNKPAGTGFEFGDYMPIEWNFIKKVYLGWEESWSKRPAKQFHRFATTSVQDLDDRDKDKSRLNQMYGGYGIKFAGEKWQGHRFRSLIWLQRHRDEYTMTTCGERGGREWMRGQKVTNFAVDYLVRKAGWTLK